MNDQNDVAQARALREQARNGGLRFDAYLPPSLAEWLLERIESGILPIRAKPYSLFWASIAI